MIKAIGFLVGQVGDLVMCSVAARQFKKQYPNSHLTLAIGKKYAHVADLFRNMPDTDALHIWDSYDNWPSQVDRDFVLGGNFDMVFNPLPPHSRPDWYNHYHYVEETCLMFGLQLPSYLQCALAERPPVEKNSRYVTLSLFASGNQLKKTIRLDDMDELASGLINKGYIPIQVGSSDLIIKGAQQAQNLSICEAVDLMRSSMLHISIDTAFAWIASAYQLPMVGLYGATYPDMPSTRVHSHNPVNPNAIYINRASVKDITVDEILEASKNFIT